MPKKPPALPVEWLSDRVVWDQRNDPNFVYKSVDFYDSFRFKNIVASIGEFVLISNADAAEPDAEEGCDPAQILTLYESHDLDLEDRYRARVQWFSRPAALPREVNTFAPKFAEQEVIEDHRPFDVDVSIETFFKKCNIIRGSTNLEAHEILQDDDSGLLTYACRYRLMPLSKRKFKIEPVLVEERKALELLKTPASKKNTPIPKTPSSLVKRMSRVSLSEQKNWSVTNTEGTKLLLKRAILMDKNEKDSPKKSSPQKNVSSGENNSKTFGGVPRRKILLDDEISNILSMELDEASEDEIPTLIIRQHTLPPSTPKRKTSTLSKTNDTVTPKKLMGVENENFNSPSTRSLRSTRKSVRYNEDDLLSPTQQTPKKDVKKTPKSVRKRLMSDSDEDFVTTPHTPRTPSRAAPKRSTPVTHTPKRGVRKIVMSQLTPTLHARAHSVEETDDWNKESKELPGREQQMEEILSFVRSKLLDRTSGCMYISGVPGTGKTATVCAALDTLKAEPGLPTFQLLEVNGMRIAEPRQAYVHIYRQLTGKTVAWEQACSLLEKRFTQAGPRRTPTVLLVDELDALCTRRQDVVYSIMEWATRGAARLAVLAVANTMDLPERALAARVASRLGLTRLTFPPYTHAQLQRIVATRLAGADVSASAVQLVARKVAAVSGDARRALSLCARALEMGRAAGGGGGAGAGGGGAGLREVEAALAEAASGAAVRAVRSLAGAERLMLRAVAAEVERTGSDETTVSRALAAAAAIVSLEGRGYRAAAGVRAPSADQALAICQRLAACRLLLLEPKPSEPRLLLNISADDVHYATKEITTY